MKPEELVAITELAKLGLMMYLNYMKQSGLNQDQIDQVYNDAKYGMIHRDPANIPSA